MPRPRRVTFAASAIQDLQDIRAWYTSQKVPHVGERLVHEVVSQVEQLPRFPDLGRVVPEFGVPHLRELIHPPFRIVYRLDEDRIRVVRVWRTERVLDVPEA
ncbi:MAG TPA: type II toxin-antitoxin system RelE/ParE family toxin [Coriobacteriia bacterium]|jgi:plasmid stabilization system protein ParE